VFSKETDSFLELLGFIVPHKRAPHLSGQKWPDNQSLSVMVEGRPQLQSWVRMAIYLNSSRPLQILALKFAVGRDLRISGIKY
jgi:hypothetical protein